MMPRTNLPMRPPESMKRYRTTDAIREFGVGPDWERS
jgi:hypothetical protein